MLALVYAPTSCGYVVLQSEHPNTTTASIKNKKTTSCGHVVLQSEHPNTTTASMKNKKLSVKTLKNLYSIQSGNTSRHWQSQVHRFSHQAQGPRLTLGRCARDTIFYNTSQLEYRC